jgi:hypothetical protein
MPFSSSKKFGIPSSSTDPNTQGTFSDYNSYSADFQPRFNDLYIHMPPFGSGTANHVIWSPSARRIQSTAAGSPTKLNFIQFSFQESAQNPKTYSQLHAAGITMYYRVGPADNTTPIIRELGVGGTGWTGAGSTHYFGLTLGQEFCVGLRVDKALAGSTGIYNFYLVNNYAPEEIMWRIQYLVGITYSGSFEPGFANLVTGATLPVNTYYVTAGGAFEDGNPPLTELDYTTDQDPVLINGVSRFFSLSFNNGGFVWYGGITSDGHAINYQYNVPDSPVNPADNRPYLIDSLPLT